jgi:hypothetical protein
MVHRVAKAYRLDPRDVWEMPVDQIAECIEFLILESKEREEQMNKAKRERRR